MKQSKPRLAEVEDFSIKPNPPSQQGDKRSVSIQKTAPQVQNNNSRSPQRQISTANRLIQKKQSVDKKIEVMRKQKIEAELKEVQSKPRISSKSRRLAEKAEIKILNIIRPKGASPPVRNLYEDDDELEHDIRLLEDCLKTRDNKAHVQTYEDKKVNIFESINSESDKRESSADRKMERKSDFIAIKKISRPVVPQVKRAESSLKPAAIPVPLKYLKSQSPSIVKHRSNSMEFLQAFQFGYRSLSPYQIPLKRSN